MRANLNQLYVFYMAARYKNLKEAACALYVSPPAVTMQIKKLEAWLGFSVFERGQGDISLTERGRALYSAVTPVFSGFDEMEERLKELMRTDDSPLRFGVHHVPANYFIPDMIAHVRAKHPELKVQMELSPQDSLLEQLFQQKLDLVLIVGDPPPNSKCKVLRLFGVEVVLVVSAAGEFGKIDSISIHDIANIPLIIQQNGTGALRYVLKFLERHKTQPNILLENLSSDVIKSFLPKLAAGAFISRFIVQRELDDGLLHEIKILEGNPTFRFNLVYSDNPYQPLKLRHFLTAVPGFSPSFSSHK